MKIRVLGCSGAEFPGQNPPGFLLDGKILFDAGSLTNVLDEKSQHKIRHIFVTHAHLDHIRGIPFLADNLIIGGRGDIVKINSIAPVIKRIRENLLNGSIWPDFTVIPEPKNGLLKFVELNDSRPISINGYSITPYRVKHSVPAVGYLVEDSRGKRFFYTGDTGPTSATWKKVGNIQIHCMIIEVSFPNKMEEIAITTGHLTTRLLQQEMSRMGRMPEKIYITHIKPQYFGSIRRELKGLHLKNLKLLRDDDIIRI